MAKEFYDPLLQELYEAGLQLHPFLEASTDQLDQPDFSDLAAAAEWLKQKNAMTDAERLRRRAAKIEAKDAAIHRFRKALNAIKEQTT